MVRMIMLQMIFGSLGSNTKVKTSLKCFIIVVVCTVLMYKDYYYFMTSRNLNIYQVIGTHRAATSYEIDNILDMYKVCENEFYEDPCKNYDRSIYKFNAT